MKKIGWCLSLVLLFGGCSNKTIDGDKTSESKLFNPEYLEENLSDLDLTLLEEINCADTSDSRDFRESPSGISEVKNIDLDNGYLSARILPQSQGNEASYFAYRIGRGKGLVPQKQYLLSVEYPDDEPRSMVILNRGSEMQEAISSGTAVVNTLGGYVNHNVASFDFPQSNEWVEYKSLFRLNDHFGGIQVELLNDDRPGQPEDGFWVIIAQFANEATPLSKGAAVSKIRLYEVEENEKVELEIPYPPEDLPRRYVGTRCEMCDASILVRSDQVATKQPVNDDPMDWFKSKLQTMKYLGINTFALDAVEFGYPQNIDWALGTANPNQWEQIFEFLKAEDEISVLPYFEYRGSLAEEGIGLERRARPLVRDPFEDGNQCSGYTPLSWVEFANVDITDPETLVDAKAMMDSTVVAWANHPSFGSWVKEHTLGTWFRARLSHMPVSFSDEALARYDAEEGNTTATTRRRITRGSASIKKAYIKWWKKKRKTFLREIQNHVSNALSRNTEMIFTSYNAESGPSIGSKRGVVTDDPSRFENIPNLYHRIEWAELINGMWRDRITKEEGQATHSSCEELIELSHAEPRPLADGGADRYYETYPFNHSYTVAKEGQSSGFRSETGLAMAKHWSLNESQMQGKLGYFVVDMKPSGPYAMLSEATALAYQDPRFILHLSSHTFNSGFPNFMRAFHQAFLALPAVPSEILEGVSSNAKVVVRAYPTENHGTYLAVINTSEHALKAISIEVDSNQEVKDVISKEKMGKRDLNLGEMYSGQVRVLHFGG